jgi:hypothetical protein
LGIVLLCELLMNTSGAWRGISTHWSLPSSGTIETPDRSMPNPVDRRLREQRDVMAPAQVRGERSRAPFAAAHGGEVQVVDCDPHATT